MCLVSACRGDRGDDRVETHLAAKNGAPGIRRAPKSACYGEGMNDRYRLGGLGDDQPLAAVTALVKRENDSLSDLLAHLAELDERQLCVALGYSSLFAYCTEALGFSQIFGGAAHRGGADVSAVSGGIRAGGERRAFVVGAVRAAAAPERGERKRAIRGVQSEELRAGRGVARRAFRTRMCGTRFVVCRCPGCGLPI